MQLKTRKKPTQERARFTVDAICEAAVQVLRAQGFKRATTRRISERAGVSVGTYYQYFPNKEALLVELFRRHMGEGMELVGAQLASVVAEKPPLEDALRRLVEGMVGLHTRDRALHRILFEEAPLPPEVRAELVAIEDKIIGAVMMLQTLYPEIDVPDPRLAASVCVHTVEALTHTAALRSEAPADLLVEEAVILLHRYLVRSGPEVT